MSIIYPSTNRHGWKHVVFACPDWDGNVVDGMLFWNLNNSMILKSIHFKNSQRLIEYNIVDLINFFSQ